MNNDCYIEQFYCPNIDSAKIQILNNNLINNNLSVNKCGIFIGTSAASIYILSNIIKNYYATSTKALDIRKHLKYKHIK